MSAASGIDIRRHDGMYVEMYAEAELVTGNAVCWWLDVRYTAEGWIGDRTR